MSSMMDRVWDFFRPMKSEEALYSSYCGEVAEFYGNLTRWQQNQKQTRERIPRIHPVTGGRSGIDIG
jgi:hypothetical protein